MNTFRLSKFLFNHHLKNNRKPFSIASTIYSPLTFFIVDDDEFKLMLEDIKNDTELRIKFFIETYFNLNYEQIKHSLYPIANNVNTEKYSYNNANRIIEFLIAMNFDKNLIIKYSSLILFDYKSVKGAYFYLSNRINSSQRSSSPTSSSSMNVKQKNNEIFLQNLIQHLQQTKSATKILKNISFPNLMS